MAGGGWLRTGLMEAAERESIAAMRALSQAASASATARARSWPSRRAFCCLSALATRSWEERCVLRRTSCLVSAAHPCLTYRVGGEGWEVRGEGW